MSVAYVFVPDPINDGSDNGLPVYIPEVIKHAHERAQHHLEQAEVLAGRASEKLKAMFPKWSVSYHAEADSPAWAVIRRADEWKPDLIVVGSHGRSALGRFFLGSVSQKVMTEAHCSVRIARCS